MPKICFIFLLLVNSFLTCHANSNNPLRDSAVVIIQLDNFSNHNEPIDSVYLIFDRFDGAGAGIIKQVYHPVNNVLEIVVPKGKYFIDLFCLGNYSDKHFGRILHLKARKKNKMLVKLNETSFYTPGFASIPPEKIDFANLSVTRFDFLR